MLGEAEDAVQEAWLRLNRSDAQAIQNLAGWLTTVTLASARTIRETTLGSVTVENTLRNTASEG